jgi:hypothetical protein
LSLKEEGKVKIESLLDDVGMLESLEERNLSNGSRWDTIVFLLEANFLEGHNLLGELVYRE